jgi:ketosteroid isomerase-like protein
MRPFVTFVILFLFLISCKENDKTYAENRKLIEQYFAHFNKHDFSKMANMYVENADFKDPSLGSGIVKQSREQTTKKYAELQQIFPNLHDEVINIYASGDKNIIVEFISTGIAADKTKLEIPICTIFTIENGMITKDFTYFDNFEENK